ncbi:HD domain-containing protein [Candidatus Microgenomates bacterium]|jgi:putative hydrolase of HD superfamily|nr:MAG: HD domain-containing protein [Candidatus Microgenomates bacterium]
MKEELFKNLFEFFKAAEKLKAEIRHGHTSNVKRKESVAEHCWLSSLVAMVLMDKLKVKLDEIKVLKMVIIHDLGEAIAGDIPSHEISERQKNKHITEKEGLKKIAKILKGKRGGEIVKLWEEFEEKKTPEACFVDAIDKFECIFQHLLAGVETWDEADFRYAFVDKQDMPFDFNGFMRDLKDYLDKVTYSELKKSGKLLKVPKENLERLK